jgi:hypothetical protein
MKVSELIECLQKFDRDRVVLLEAHDNDFGTPSVHTVKRPVEEDVFRYGMFWSKWRDVLSWSSLGNVPNPNAKEKTVLLKSTADD